MMLEKLRTFPVKIRKFFFKLSLSKEDKIQLALGTMSYTCSHCNGEGRIAPSRLRRLKHLNKFSPQLRNSVCQACRGAGKFKYPWPISIYHWED